ncbi:MAG: DUF4112 domain-containing protein [Bacteroidia bacterium]
MLTSKKKPFQPNQEAQARLAKIESFTRLLDNQFKIPGTDFRFGIDPLIGLIPFAGDIFSLGFQGVLLTSMMKFGVSRKVMILMAVNIAIDFIVGSIPVLGNIFDFYFKSSQRNLELMKRHFHEGKHQGSGTGTLLLVLLILVAVMALVGYLVYLLIDFLADAIRGWM